MRPKILERLRGVRKAGDGWLAFCPSHDDQGKRSLSVGVGEGGQTLLHCFVGCPTERVVTTVGMTLADLGPPAPVDPPRLTLAAFARAKGFSEEFLREHGVREDGTSLIITYRLQDGSLAARQRRRSALIAGDGSSWDGPRGSSPVAYGLWKLDDAAEKGELLLVEGETDALSGWRHNLPTLGIPGADLLKTLTAEALTGIARLDVVQEPDRGGETFVRRTAARLRELGWTGQAFALRLSAKDLNALHLTAGASFADELLRAKAAAIPLVDAARPVADAPSGAAEGPGAMGDPVTSEVGEPVSVRHGDEHRVTWPLHQVEVTIAGLREHSDGVSAEVVVALKGEEIHWSKINVASTPSREGLVKKLSSHAPKIPWRPLIERSCRLCVQSARSGNPTVVVVPRVRPGPRYVLAPIAPAGETTVLAGDGGAGKSYFVHALALAIASGARLPGGLHAEITGPVLVLDWEGTEDEFFERTLYLAHGLGCPVSNLHYKPMIAPLTAELGAVRAEVSRLGAVAVILDSLAPASGSDPEGTDAAVRTMSAARALAPASRLVVAHVSKATAESQAPARPFGSVFLQNLPRSVWEVRRSDEDEGEDLLLALYHRKVNHGRRHRPIALRFHFAPDAVTLHPADLAASADLLGRLPLGQRILRTLTSGAMPATDLAEALAAAVGTVLKTLTRLEHKGLVHKLTDTKPARWGLAAR